MQQNDLISRKAVHDLVRELKRYAWTSPVSIERHTTVAVDDVQFGLDRLPAVEAEPVKHGRWVYEKGITAPSGYECSLCRKTRWFYTDIQQSFDYCPNCGAKMDGKSNVPRADAEIDFDYEAED